MPGQRNLNSNAIFKMTNDNIYFDNKFILLIKIRMHENDIKFLYNYMDSVETYIHIIINSLKIEYSTYQIQRR